MSYPRSCMPKLFWTVFQKNTKIWPFSDLSDLSQLPFRVIQSNTSFGSPSAPFLGSLLPKIEKGLLPPSEKWAKFTLSYLYIQPNPYVYSTLVPSEGSFIPKKSYQTLFEKSTKHFKWKVDADDGRLGIRKSPLPCDIIHVHSLTYSRNVCRRMWILSNAMAYVETSCRGSLGISIRLARCHTLYTGLPVVFYFIFN